MPVVERVSFATVLKAIERQIAGWPAVSKLGITADQVRIVDSDDNPHTQGTVEILIRLRRASIVFTGGERADARLIRRVPVAVWTQLLTDPADRAKLWLTDCAHGHIPVEEAVLDALWFYLPKRLANDPCGAGNQLVWKPITFAGAGDPTKEKPRNGWGVSVLDFDVPYLPPVTQDYLLPDVPVAPPVLPTGS